jgi:hypothetical protein
MTLSQNAWPAYDTTEHFVRVTEDDFAFWAANDDVGVIFADLIKRFNETVEQIAGNVLDDWSWADRHVRDSPTVVSNHASATALDLNALKHVRGVRGTFAPIQIVAIRVILALYDGVIRWGGDYKTSIVDEMHWEINANAVRTKALAAQIRSNNMAVLTPDEITAIAVRVWNVDVIPDATNPKNPTWQPSSEFTHIKTVVDQHTVLLGEILAALKVTKKSDPGLDDQG